MQGEESRKTEDAGETGRQNELKIAIPPNSNRFHPSAPVVLVFQLISQGPQIKLLKRAAAFFYLSNNQ